MNHESVTNTTSQEPMGLFLCLLVSPKWHKWWHQSSSMASRQLLRENEPAPVLAHSNGWVGWRMRCVARNLICGYLVCVEGNIRQLFVSYCFPGFVVLGWVVLGWVGLCWVRVKCVLAFFLLLSDWLFGSFLQRAMPSVICSLWREFWQWCEIRIFVFVCVPTAIVWVLRPWRELRPLPSIIRASDRS